MKLIFVYNADTGKVNALFDIAHKVISPDTYDCGLCKLTHSALSEREAWKEFRENSAMEMEFLHRDEFKAQYDLEVELPVILRVDGQAVVAMSAREIGSCRDVRELIARVRELTRT